MRILLILALTAILFSCNREEIDSSGNKVKVQPRINLCDEFYQGEPTLVQGLYIYEEVILQVQPDYEYTLEYNAFTEKNKFEILDANDNIISSTLDYIAGSGYLNFKVCPTTPLPLKMVVKCNSETLVLDRWDASISCHLQLCEFLPDCCTGTNIQVSWNVDSENPGCCLYILRFDNNSNCINYVYKDGIKIGEIQPQSSFQYIFSKCENTPDIIFTMGPSPKNFCKKFITPRLGSLCKLS